MKLALQNGEIDMAFRDFTPTELTSLGKAKGIKVHTGNGVVIRYLVFNVKRAPTNNLAVRKAIAYLMPRQTIATRVYHGFVQAALLDGAGRSTRPHRRVRDDVRRRRAWRRPRRCSRRPASRRRSRSTSGGRRRHYGDASADEYAEIQRASNGAALFKVTLKSAEWAQYSAAPGKQYNAFQLGWFPDYPDAEDYIVPFYQPDNFMSNGYNNPKMTELIKAEHAARTTPARARVIKAAQVLAAKDVPIIPYWQGKMIAVSRTNVQGIDRRWTPRSSCGSG